MNDPDLSVNICGVRLRNPTVLASGILGLSEDLLIRVGEAGAGAVVTKSCGLKPRAGYPNPVVADWGAGLINAVGLSNPGVDTTMEEVRTANFEGKLRRRGRFAGYRSDWKKAYVKLQPGQKMPEFADL